MAAIDKVLLKELMAAKKAPRNFVAVPGKKDTALILSKRPITAGRANEARGEVEGTKVFRGRCSYDGTAMVFETTDNAPADLKKKIKETIRDKAGLAYKVSVVIVETIAEIDDQTPDADELREQAREKKAQEQARAKEEVGPEPTPSPKSPESPTTPEVKTPEVTTPEVTTPEVKTPEVTTPEVKTPETPAPTPGESGTETPSPDVPKTGKIPAPPPGGPKAPKGPAAAPVYTRWAMAATAAKEQFERLQQVAPSRTSPFRARLTKASNLVKAQQIKPGEPLTDEIKAKKDVAYREATAILEAVRDEAKALAEEVEKELEKGGMDSTTRQEMQFEFKMRAREVRAQLDEIAAKDEDAVRPLMTKLATALGHAQAFRFDTANATIEEIAVEAEDILGELGPATKPPKNAKDSDDEEDEDDSDGEAAKKDKAPKVRRIEAKPLQVARQVWAKSRTSTLGSLETFRDAVRAKAQSKPEKDLAERALKPVLELARILDEDRLDDNLSEAISASSYPRREKLVEQAAKQALDMLAMLKPMDLPTLDANPFAPMSLRSVLTPSLRMIYTKLKP